MTVRQSTSILGPLVKIFSETSISARCSRLSGAAERRSKAVRSSIISSTESLPFAAGLMGGVYPIANSRKKLLGEGGEGDTGFGAAKGDGVGGVVGIGGDAEAAELRVDFRAASLGGFHGLQNHHCATFAQDQAATIFAEGAASVRRDHAHGFPGF